MRFCVRSALAFAADVAYAFGDAFARASRELR